MRIAAACIFLASILPAQSWSWSTVGGGTQRFKHSLATSPTGSVLLFGGMALDGVTYLGDTQLWNNTSGSWTPLSSTSSPGIRARLAMVFDSARNRVVLFGGETGNYSSPTVLGDTWEWNGNWQPRISASYPPPRAQHAMAYDAARARVVLFGGRNGAVLGDTWEWDGTDWAQQVPQQSPSPRLGHGMAFDPVRGHVLLYGGLAGTYDGSTWEWSGTGWTQLSPSVTPGVRAWHSMATDPVRGRIVVFGGANYTAALMDTWEWNGATWTSVSPTVHPPANSPAGAIAYCPQRARLLYDDGGNGTWTFDPPPPSVRSYGTGCGGLTLAALPNSQPLLGQTFTSRITGCPPTTVAAFMAVGFSDQALGPFALPLDLGGYGMPNCRLYHDAVALFLPCQLSGTTATHALPLPNAPALAGIAPFLQGWVSAPGVNPGGVLTSSALALTLGY